VTHVYRFSRGALIEWRTSEAEPQAATLRPRSQQVVVARGQGRARVSVPPSTADATATLQIFVHHYRQQGIM